MNAFASIERSALRQWAALTECERQTMDQGIAMGTPVSAPHPNLACLWWVEVGARQDGDYRLLPLMSIKQG